jgi:subtilisin family serine protease
MKFLLVCTMLLSFGANASTPLTELIVKVKPGQTLPAFSGAQKIQNLFGNVFIIRGSDLKLIESVLKNHSSIEYTERNSRAEKTALPTPEKGVDLGHSKFAAGEFNDPQASKVWSFKDASSNGISVEAAYRINSSSNTQEIIVAVVDTGVDATHEDLKDVMWINENEIPANGLDDDQNGYVDDINGINTLIRDTQGRATGNIKDTHSHGTHVSGTIGAKQNN